MNRDERPKKRIPKLTDLPPAKAFAKMVKGGTNPYAALDLLSGWNRRRIIVRYSSHWHHDLLFVHLN